MKLRLAVLSFSALFALIGVSVWATGHVSVVPAIQALFENPTVGFNPWFVATLFDAYFGFLWFWAWIAYKENHALKSFGWLIALLLTGNMGMAVYMLIQLKRLPVDATPQDLLLRRGG